MYQTGSTIEKTLDAIQQNELVLPAIQREFVWKPEQICRLFDSLMQGYPFGTFLYWKVASENSGKFKFFDFVRDYHQRDNPHCPPLPEMHGKALTAVLDGQQRLTALNIGLRGSMARKLSHKWWNNPDAFPKRCLHLNLLHEPDAEDEEGTKYEFRFLDATQIAQASDNECWFPVRDVLALDNAGPATSKWLNQNLPSGFSSDAHEHAHEALYRLYEVIRSKHLIAYYAEEDQELDKALQIFIRMNDGGTPLSHSDLLLSIAVSQWKSHDARQEVHKLVDELNLIGTGFTFSKDLVLKAGLMLSNIGSVGFKVDNFNRENMATLEDKWGSVSDALKLTVRLVADFGFSGQNLTSHSSILPIAYYLHNRQLEESYLTSNQYAEDRCAILSWLIRSLLKSGVWGSGLDSLLTELRSAINSDSEPRFNVERISEAMTRRGKTLKFEDEEVEDLLDLKYGDRLIFALLSLLFPSVNLRNQFHIDHIFPYTKLTSKYLKSTDLSEDQIRLFCDQRDRLANLQLLPGPNNIEKGAKMPNDWLSDEFRDMKERDEYRRSHLMGNIPDSIADFPDFYNQRRAKLKEKILDILG